MRDLNGRVALVTGAASGIGRETALLLARQGMTLVLCDINPDALETIRAEVDAISSCIVAEVVDVSQREAMAAFAETVHAQVPAVDVLINNAGVGLAADALSTELDDWDWILSINLYGVIHGCHYFIPPMVARGQGGHVVNIASMLGYFPSPNVIGYAAAKFGVFGMSQCLRMDLEPHGIGVSVVCPGIVKTGIIGASRIRGREDAEKTRAHVDGQYVKRNYGPDRVAKGILKAIQRNKAVQPVSPEAWLAYLVTRLSPALGRLLSKATAKQMLD